MRRNGKIFQSLGSWFVIFFGLIIWGFPLLWLLVISFRSPELIYRKDLILLFKPVLANYERIFTNRSFLRQLLNSIFISVSSGLISITLGTMAAYGLSRFRFRGSSEMAFVILISRMIPPVVLTIPLFTIFSNMSIINTKQALVIVNTAFNLSLSIWLMRGFLEDIPVELEEAASIDGASRFLAFRKIIVPLALPGLAVTTVLVVIFSWNEFMFASIFAYSPNAKTLTVGAADFITAYATEWGPMFASGVMIVMPAVMFVLLMQKHLVRGLTFGALK
jgi:multiple sugar transport system permease protein